MKPPQGYAEVRALIEQHAKLGSEGRVLEIGAQDGRGTTGLKNAVALDQDPQHESVIRGNALNIGAAFPSQKFALIFSNELLSRNGLHSRSIREAAISNILNREISEGITRLAEEHAKKIHESVFEALKEGGIAIHSVHASEQIIGSEEQLKQIGFEILKKSANYLVLRKPEAKR